MKVALAYFEKFIDMSGGIERVCCNMANALTARGHEVSIIYCYGQSGKPFYPLDPSVKLYNLMAYHPGKWKADSLSQCVSGTTKAIREGIRLFSKNKARDWNESAKGRMICGEIRQTMETIEPDVIISFRYETSNYLLHFAHVTAPVITMFHIDPHTALDTAPEGERRAVEESAFAQVLLKGDIDVVREYCPKANLVWIPNAVPQYEAQVDLEAPKKQYKIINTARLNKAQKRQHFLVEAFAQTAKEFPEWTVELWGGGNESGEAYAEELRQKIHESGLADRVFLKGESSHIIDEYMQADIFCFPSAYEGFPLAMTEAMSAGLPTVACYSCSAVRQLVRERETGILVEEGAEGLAKGLKELMGDKQLRVSLGKAAREDMKQYAPEKIWDMWENLIRTAASVGCKEKL